MRDVIGALLAALNLVFCAMNVAEFASSGRPFALGAAVFCGGSFYWLLKALYEPR